MYLSPYPEKSDALGPASLLGLFCPGAEQKGVCLQLGLSVAAQPCFPPLLSLSHFHALAFLLPISRRLQLMMTGFYPVTLYSSVSCTLWWCQMAAGTNPVPCSEMNVFTSEKIDEGRGLGGGDLFHHF